MVIVSNFVTDLIDEAIQTGASNLLLNPGIEASLLINGKITRKGDRIDWQELEEDIAALGITLDRNQEFYCFHSSGPDTARKVKVIVRLNSVSRIPFISMSILEEIPKIELEDRKLI